MPITNPNQAEIFSDDYVALGAYRNDGSRIPWYNSTALLVQPGEPLLVKWGASGAEECFFAQEAIRPTKWGYLIRAGDWAADLPANLTANVIIGDELYWDEDNSEVALEADVTNGWLVGDAGTPIDPSESVQETPATDGNGRVIVGTTSSTRIRIQSRPGASTTKGTVTIY